MMAKSFHVSLICLLFVRINYGATCDTFKKVLMELHQREGNPFNKTISGCIERIAFNDENVITKAFVRNQTIEILGQDAIRNMVRLKLVSFWGCNLREIQSGAFRNIPRLKSVEISHGNLKTVRREIFKTTPDLEVIRLQNNVVSDIEDEAFANLPSLKRFYVKNNQLELWKKEWFTNSTGLVLLDLQFNKIKSLPAKAFQKLTNLTHIYLDFNEISSLENAAFKDLRDVQYLGLRFNRLTKIGDDVFPNTVKIKTLRLDANYLNYLPMKMLQKIAVKELTVDGNPWICACLHQITDWLYSKHASLRKSDECSGSLIPECGVPKDNPTSCREDFSFTKEFMGKLKGFSKEIGNYCARLDDYILLNY